MKTIYRIARDDEYPGLYDKFDMTIRLTWPVIIAERGGDIIGILGTHDVGERLCAGPLQVNMPEGRTHVFVAAKLIKLYDEYMAKIGIKKFAFYVEKTNISWMDQFARIGIYNKTWENDECIWFERVF